MDEAKHLNHIFDGDYSCEERQPGEGGEGPKVSVTLVNESGEEKQVTVEDFLELFGK